MGGSASVGTAHCLQKSCPDSGESLCADSVFPGAPHEALIKVSRLDPVSAHTQASAAADL